MATTESAAGQSPSGQIDALLQEDRRYPPSPEFVAQANWNDPSIYQRAEADPEAFWAEQAQSISWFKPWDKILEWNVPWAKWFGGAEATRGQEGRPRRDLPRHDSRAADRHARVRPHRCAAYGDLRRV